MIVSKMPWYSSTGSAIEDPPKVAGHYLRVSALRMSLELSQIARAAHKFAPTIGLNAKAIGIL